VLSTSTLCPPHIPKKKLAVILGTAMQNQ